MLKMMTDSLKKTIPLSVTAHSYAEQFSRYQSNSQKAKQVYLNTLAVYAVNNYLNYLGWETNLETSDSWNPLLQSLMNIADLDLVNYGKVECLFVLRDQDWVEIPAEVSSDRISYIILQFDQSLRQATFLGFVTEVPSNRLALNQLQSLDCLPDHLSQLKRVNHSKKLSSSNIVPKHQPNTTQPIKLGKWLEGRLENGWQPLEELLIPTKVIAFRSIEQLKPQKEHLLSGVSRFKILELNLSVDKDNELQKISLALILNISPLPNREKDISVKIYPVNHHTYLPQGLEFLVLNEQEIPMMQIQAYQTETIEFRFTGDEGEFFSIKASLHNCDRIETFVI
ncbi:hypothetical protein STA3757_22120 [Stanieria sp. NIES-3757]|nr:hypothetical protein STA3757_22120 [Stanieria sp. NIES-3757]